MTEPPPALADSTSTPGANKSVQRPVLVNEAAWSPSSLAARVIACTTRAGDESQASVLSFPAAMAYATPAAMELQTA